MAVTRDNDFPPAIAQLVQSFNRCADGHDMTDVIEAAANMLSCALHNYGAARGMSKQQMMNFASSACKGVCESVEMNWKRRSKPSDVEVKSQ